MKTFLTLDLGTTLYKVALFDEAGRMLALRRVTPPVLHPKPGWWEVDPRAFKQCLAQAVGALRQEVGTFENVAAVSFATQANSIVLLDERDEALTPIVLWPDERAAELRAELETISQTPDFRSRTGMPRFSHLLGLAKVLRWKQTNPRVLQDTRRFCYISDFLTLWMTGRHVTEGGVAGISGAMDVKAFAWWDQMLTRVGIGAAQMPSIVRAGTELGPLGQEVAAEMGLPNSCRFVVGCLDQYAGAIGTGTVAPGRVTETTGTVLSAVRCADHLDLSLPMDVYQAPASDPGLFFQMSFSSTSANLLEWFRDQQADKPSFEALSREAESAGEPGFVVHPFGGRIEDCFRDVPGDAPRGQIVRAIMNCVAGALDRQVQSLTGGNSPAEIRAAGGAAKSDLWLRIKSKRLGIPVVALECEEPTSLGAAMLAARALGLGDLAALASRWIKPRRTGGAR